MDPKQGVLVAMQANARKDMEAYKPAMLAMQAGANEMFEGYIEGLVSHAS